MSRGSAAHAIHIHSAGPQALPSADKHFSKLSRRPRGQCPSRCLLAEAGTFCVLDTMYVRTTGRPEDSRTQRRMGAEDRRTEGLEASTVSPSHMQDRSTVLHLRPRACGLQQYLAYPVCSSIQSRHPSLEPTHNFPVDMPDRPARDSTHVSTFVSVRQGRGHVDCARAFGCRSSGLVAWGKSLFSGSKPTDQTDLLQTRAMRSLCCAGCRWARPGK